MRSSDSEEQRPTFSGRSATSQISSDCSTYVNRQRQTFSPVTFSAHDDLSAAPVDVIQLHGSEFPGPEPQTREYRQHGEVAATDHAAAVATGQQLPCLTRLKCLRQARQA
jgi:hypothetical protein